MSVRKNENCPILCVSDVRAHCICVTSWSRQDYKTGFYELTPNCRGVSGLGVGCDLSVAEQRRVREVPVDTIS